MYKRQDEDQLRPSNLAAKALCSVDHTRFNCDHDPYPVRLRLVAAAKYCVRKTRHYSLSGQSVEQNKRSQSLARVSTSQRGKPVLFLCSRSIIVGLTFEYHRDFRRLYSGVTNEFHGQVGSGILYSGQVVLIALVSRVSFMLQIHIYIILRFRYTDIIFFLVGAKVAKVYSRQ